MCDSERFTDPDRDENRSCCCRGSPVILRSNYLTDTEQDWFVAEIPVLTECCGAMRLFLEEVFVWMTLHFPCCSAGVSVLFLGKDCCT